MMMMLMTKTYPDDEEVCTGRWCDEGAGVAVKGRPKVVEHIVEVDCLTRV